MASRFENGVYVVRDQLSVDRYVFDGTAEVVKANIDYIREVALSNGMVGEGSFDVSLDSGYYGDHCDLSIVYYYDRTETEKEKAKREAAEKLSKEEVAKKRKIAAEKRKLKKDAEYAEFLRLKEKFGNI